MCSALNAKGVRGGSSAQALSGCWDCAEGQVAWKLEWKRRGGKATALWHKTALYKQGLNPRATGEAS